MSLGLQFLFVRIQPQANSIFRNVEISNDAKKHPEHRSICSIDFKHHFKHISSTKPFLEWDFPLPPVQPGFDIRYNSLTRWMGVIATNQTSYLVDLGQLSFFPDDIAAFFNKPGHVCFTFDWKNDYIQVQKLMYYLSAKDNHPID